MKNKILFALLLIICFLILLIYRLMSSVPYIWEYPNNIDEKQIYSMHIFDISNGKYATTEIEKSDFKKIISVLQGEKESDFNKCIRKQKYYSVDSILDKKLVITINGEDNRSDNWEFLFYKNIDNVLIQYTKHNECYVCNIDELRKTVNELSEE